MFYRKDGDVLVPTALQHGDRLRVRPKLGRCFVWRPDIRLFWPIYEFKPGGRLWTSDHSGCLRKWLEIPPAKTGESLDLLGRIIHVYGEDNFRPAGLNWVEEPPSHIDGRFDFVAVGSTANSVTS